MPPRVCIATQSNQLKSNSESGYFRIRFLHCRLALEQWLAGCRTNQEQERKTIQLVSEQLLSNQRWFWLDSQLVIDDSKRVTLVVLC